MAYTIDDVKNDLINIDAQQFYIKYILKSNIWYFADFQHTKSRELIDKMDAFKEIVSQSFGVSFHSAQIVGSAKLGFSLAPQKAFREFVSKATRDGEKESDIDIAVISNNLFNDIWERLRECKKQYLIPKYTAITKSIFLGYINDKDFKDHEFFRKEWEEKISVSNIKLQNEISLMHPISYRIYRSWEDLQDYQMNSIHLLKEELLK